MKAAIIFVSLISSITFAANRTAEMIDADIARHKEAITQLRNEKKLIKAENKVAEIKAKMASNSK
jgi:hypothetical protein